MTTRRPKLAPGGDVLCCVPPPLAPPPPPPPCAVGPLVAATAAIDIVGVLWSAIFFFKFFPKNAEPQKKKGNRQRKKINNLKPKQKHQKRPSPTQEEIV
jgi:hypothetical protein